MEAMLQIVEEELEITNKISYASGNFSANKLHGRIASRLKVTKPDLDNILHLLCDDQLEYLSKTSESSGGQYQISKENIDLLVTYLFVKGRILYDFHGNLRYILCLFH